MSALTRLAHRFLVVAAILSPLPSRAADGPDYQCLGYGPLGLGSSDRDFYGHAPQIAELMPRLNEALAQCEQAKEIRPNDGWTFAVLAKLRLLAGKDAQGDQAARRSAELGADEGRVLLGVLSAAAGSYAQARELFLQARSGGAVGALANYNLGVLWAQGWGVPRDDREAANYFQRAAQAHDAGAMVLLGQWHWAGRAVAQDRERAAALWRDAAERLATDGDTNPLRLHPPQPPFDVSVPLAWYRQQADAGELWAMTWLGQLARAGQWLPQDSKAAMDWFSKAGNAGHAAAAHHMSRMYKGGLGVPKDEGEALRWDRMPELFRCREQIRQASAAPRCDQLAGDPNARDKVTAGLPASCMRQPEIVQEAVAACRQAVAEPSSPARHRAQLARALAFQQQMPQARMEAQRAAAQGSPRAMVQLGVMDQRGVAGPKDEAAALQWYRKAAQAGDEEAKRLLLVAAGQGRSVEKDSFDRSRIAAAPAQAQTARTPLELAQAGDADSQYEVAVQAEQANNMAEALRWYQAAADQGQTMAKMVLAELYETGRGVPRDLERAIQIYQPLADGGSTEARYRLAQIHLAKGQNDEAVRLLTRIVDQGDTRAPLDLAEMYEGGRGVQRNLPRAIELYKSAADQGSSWAQARLGTLFLRGEGMSADAARALPLLRKAADAGQMSAMNNLGWMHEKGLGLPADPQAAVERYALAANSIPEARGNLERLFAKGELVPRDPAQALEWYRRGADAGVAEAQWRLGRMHMQGAAGVPSDEDKAAKYLQAALAQGHTAAKRDLGELYVAKAARLGGGEPGTPSRDAALRLLLDAWVCCRHPAAQAALEKQGGSEWKDLQSWLDRRVQPAPAEAPRWPTGLSTAADKGQMHAVRIRAVNAGARNMVKAVGASARRPDGPNVYDIVPWTDEDARSQASGARR
ncbi:SEL1-like repeat protein [Ramlibacter humi]|nr:tetratricopeptide repeat protein [Ramlibacter humi]